jgi:hypothetical protein
MNVSGHSTSVTLRRGVVPSPVSTPWYISQPFLIPLLPGSYFCPPTWLAPTTSRRLQPTVASAVSCWPAVCTRSRVRPTRSRRALWAWRDAEPDVFPAMRCWALLDAAGRVGLIQHQDRWRRSRRAEAGACRLAWSACLGQRRCHASRWVISRAAASRVAAVQVMMTSMDWAGENRPFCGWRAIT